MEDPSQILQIQALNRNFTIPKRKRDEINHTETNGDGGNAVTPAPVLQNAYASVVATPVYSSTSQVYDCIQAAIFQHMEKPKTGITATVAGMTYKDSYLDTDTSLPKELTAMFQPLFCKLCNMHLSSSVVAKLHYKGKNHEKKIRKFLIDYSERTGEPLHKRAKLEWKKTDNPDDNDPKYFHCDVCDLPLTGRLHAESHYLGKNHQRVVAGKKAPAGKGYYDESGKWVRTIAAKTDSTGRDGFGQDFTLSKELAPPTSIFNPETTKLRCDICQVSVTSLQQIEMHYKGQKHQKKLKLLGMDSPESENNTDGMIASKDSILSSVMNRSNESTKDLSVFRTPSGYFYCKLCDMTVNSEIQFKQHLNSKNHAKKLAQNNSNSI